MKKILVIEDEAEIRTNIVDILMLSGFDVESAENGRVGVEKALAISPALVISDINMPLLDGFGVLEELRRHKLTETTPFLFLSAKTEGSDIRQGMNLGADDYLTKPFEIDDLLSAVETRLQKSAAIEEKSKEQLDSLRHNIRKSFPHELLTPLTAIIGFSEFLLTEYDDIPAEEAKEMIADILFSGKRLHRTVNNLLFFAQLEVIDPIEQKKQGLLNFETNVQYFLPEKVRQVAIFHDREAELKATFGEGIIEAPSDYVTKIIEELVDNAFKYSEAGTVVEVSGQIEDGEYLFVIDDCGRGMSHEQINNIGAYMQFDRQFYEQQGSGLGLAIAKRCAEIFGGSFSLEPKPEKGLRAYVRLPIVQQEEIDFAEI